MSHRKGLLTRVGETLDAYREERRVHATEKVPAGRRSRLSWLGRQIIPNIGTVLLVAVLLFTVSSLAAPRGAPATTSTSTISYQGRLADSGGNPLTGMYNLEFRIYDVPSGGTALWEEFWTGGNSVAVSDGLFNVMLGSIDNTLAAAIEGYNELYLGITVGTDSEMEPRVQLGSVPFAMQALFANVPDGSVTTAKLAPGAATQHQAVSTGMYGNCSSNEWVDLPSQTVTLTTEGGSVLVLSSGSYTPESQVWVVGYWRLIRDDTFVLASNSHVFSQNDWATVTLFGSDTPTAGSHTYKVQWRCSSGTLQASGGAYTQNLLAIELKR